MTLVPPCTLDAIKTYVTFVLVISSPSQLYTQHSTGKMCACQYHLSRFAPDTLKNVAWCKGVVPIFSIFSFFVQNRFFRFCVKKGFLRHFAFYAKKRKVVFSFCRLSSKKGKSVFGRVSVLVNTKGIKSH